MEKVLTEKEINGLFEYYEDKSVEELIKELNILNKSIKSSIRSVKADIQAGYIILDLLQKSKEQVKEELNIARNQISLWDIYKDDEVDKGAPELL